MNILAFVLGAGELLTHGLAIFPSLAIKLYWAGPEQGFACFPITEAEPIGFPAGAGEPSLCTSILTGRKTRTILRLLHLEGVIRT